ncbi:MAG TPA: hypothetical protein PLK34_03020 [Candidatus Pacearchaeota archaeon]|nr:hypothetical protein [Candidatus Pacearchaeota archaeon]
MKNKRKFSKNLNQKESQIQAIKIVLFILLIVLISVLIFNYSSKFSPSAQKPSSLKEICNSFCETNQRTAYCFLSLKIKRELKGTCDELSTNSEYSSYNIERCENFSCAVDTTDKTCVIGLNGFWTTPQINEDCPQIEGKILRKVKSTDSAPVEGQICCREILG